jgi:hypothetical protein
MEMITYKNNPVMQRYVDRLGEAGALVRAAKVDIFGADSRRLMSTEEAADYVETAVHQEFKKISQKLSKQVSSDVCNVILAVLRLVLDHPELINDIDYAIQSAMKRW